MSAFPQQRKKLSLTQRFSRLAIRLQDPEWRRYAKVLLLGKVLGVGVVMLFIMVCAEFWGTLSLGLFACGKIRIYRAGCA